MNDIDFQEITRYIYNVCGIALGDEKKYLLLQRLQPVAEQFGCVDLTEFAALLRLKGNDSSLREKVVVAITTNETSFFRDVQPFLDFENHILPELIQIASERKHRSVVRKGNQISIWSAASSTGQEAYSLSMIINESLELSKDGVVPTDFLITGTDISSRVLAQAMAGEFSEHEVGRGLPVGRLKKHFEQIDETWVAKPHLRELVLFRQLNLMDRFIHLGGFDVVFIRNVLIYFDDDTKRKILEQIYQMLTPEGILVLGSAENLYGIFNKFESVKYGSSIFYKKVE